MHKTLSVAVLSLALFAAPSLVRAETQTGTPEAAQAEKGECACGKEGKACKCQEEGKTCGCGMHKKEKGKACKHCGHGKKDSKAKAE